MHSNWVCGLRVVGIGIPVNVEEDEADFTLSARTKVAAIGC
jgi:hypothetical protein